MSDQDPSSSERSSPRVYTRRGDDGTTALRTGERVRKDDGRIELLGALDEAQAFLGLARAEASGEMSIAALLVILERDLWILMAEATTSADASDLVGGETAVDQAMVDALEVEMDRRLAAEQFPREFSVPGENCLSATLDVARTVVRRAERLAIGVAISPLARTYLNRLSDLCWVLARSAEEEHPTNHRFRPPQEEA